ncbi:opioid-binding protein/cell adhesion molecule homolog isoform X2 [Cryptotermes secundus]|uniref:opioid-binding protein/cell adhesion molecule homolog isoform X2 n=1 Tax=Cryptotermes secundus TaxID=105785 RepID=UPI001454D940|nr:opioid-binding protein/cell adhesion molecule homolog isoform X2 [Cryptotermes secundus]
MLRGTRRAHVLRRRRSFRARCRYRMTVWRERGSRDVARSLFHMVAGKQGNWMANAVRCVRGGLRWLLLLTVLTIFVIHPVATDITDVPKFGEPITNVTVPVGREATLTCVVDDLATYKVAWLRVDTQTILTIASHVITKNHRIGVTHSDHRTWYLHIRDMKESDRGWYMCQINTDPMKSQVGYLEVVVPPDILDYPTSTDMVVREGTNVTLRCAATGSPQPSIIWRREGGEAIPLGNGQEVASVEGPVFNITRVNRLHMGAYLCIASNGVPPTVSKRIMLIVHFPPMIWIQNQLVGAYEGQQITLDCNSEAYPKSINYWTGEKGEIIAQGGRYEPVLLDNAYKVHMKLTIRSVGPTDFGTYKCVSKNSLGDTDGSIRLYQKPAGAHPSDKLHPGTNEIMDLSDPQQISKQRDLKLRGGNPSDNSLDLLDIGSGSGNTSLSVISLFLMLVVLIVRHNTWTIVQQTPYRIRTRS